MMKPAIVQAARWIASQDATAGVPKRDRAGLRAELRTVGAAQRWPIVQSRSLDAAFPTYEAAYAEVDEYVQRKKAAVAA